jgi:hypothetical protein
VAADPSASAAHVRFVVGDAQKLFVAGRVVSRCTTLPEPLDARLEADCRPARPFPPGLARLRSNSRRHRD